MQPLYEMLAQNGQAVELMARQFNLSQQQAQLAMEALMPAFSQGLKRNASDPYGVSAFLQALSTGQHARYYEDASRAFTPEGMAEGNGILGHLFGSKELSRAVAAQAAQATGIQQDILKQMLPALASMIMGGLFKQSTGQTQQAQAGGGFGAGGNILGEIIEQMMKQGGGMMGQPQSQPRAQPQPNPANPFDNPFGKILQDMFGGGAQPAPQPQTQRRQAPDPMADNPLGRIFEEMMRGGQRQAPEPEPQPRTAPKPNPSGRARNPYDDLFGDMFESGRKQRDDYQKSMESVFDQYLKGMERHR